MKNALDVFICTLNTFKERFNELEDKSIGIIQTETQRKKWVKKMPDYLKVTEHCQSI